MLDLDNKGLSSNANHLDRQSVSRKSEPKHWEGLKPPQSIDYVTFKVNNIHEEREFTQSAVCTEYEKKPAGCILMCEGIEGCYEERFVKLKQKLSMHRYFRDPDPNRIPK